ncbi:hypothetical protein A0H81_10550 [Grifola frondosa]|uniref:Uncharacterized protein n=1 Tax=Grifola frondosa TaxID=5627 RepID=A0A1C7LZ73_GRIFR|nr:hypothetical protein A0H81_10550 [Grifola frondosa]
MPKRGCGKGVTGSMTRWVGTEYEQADSSPRREDIGKIPLSFLNPSSYLFDSTTYVDSTQLLDSSLSVCVSPSEFPLCKSRQENSSTAHWIVTTSGNGLGIVTSI